jgi:uncharacterized protein
MALTIWRITDGKAGHDSQSVGLCDAIGKIKESKCFDIHIDTPFQNYKNLFLKQFPSGNEYPNPDLIVGAGHKTHLPMICAKRVRSGKTIVLMKPSLPLSFFDICITPEHDQIEGKDNLIKTKGAINPLTYNPDKSPNTGLFLVGGPSKHYAWNDDLIVKQITQILNDNPEIQWSVADSPRTPKTTLNNIITLPNVDILNFENTDSKTIRELIFKTDNIWISKDSVSMIYESLSSGAAVGILDVKQKNKNKISKTINNMINEELLTSFDMWKNTKKLIAPPIKFNEANRCALLLSERGILD